MEELIVQVIRDVLQLLTLGIGVALGYFFRPDPLDARYKDLQRDYTAKSMELAELKKGHNAQAWRDAKNRLSGDKRFVS
jgi:hypothetical protein